MRRHPKAAAAVLSILLASLALGVSLATATAPSVTIENASAPEYVSVEAKGTVNPEELETSYHFEYATQAQFEASEWAEAISRGFGSFPPGSGTSPLAVERTLEGLKPGTVYHLRLVAENADGSDQAVAASTFETKPGAAPEATISPVTAPTATSAHFSGTIDPNAPEAAPASDPVKAGFDTGWRFECTPACPGLGGVVEADNAAHTVEADATGLLPNQTYEVTLVAESGTGTDSAGPLSFQTDALGPEVLTNAVHAYPTPTSTHLSGFVNPHNTPTDYFFEVATAADFSDAQSFPPSEDADAGSANNLGLVDHDVTGLQPGTTYHYRLVADNGVGSPVLGEAESFATPASVPGPEVRHYELVSPAKKNGGLILSADFAAAGGRALVGMVSDLDGGGLGAPTLAVRQPDGSWSTKSILPPSELRPYPSWGTTLHDEGLTTFAGKWSRGLFGGESPIVEARLDEFGNQTIVGTFDSRMSTYFLFQASSDDLSRIFALSSQPFDPEHTSGLQIYEVSKDPPVLASRLPDGTVPTCNINLDGFIRVGANSASHHHWVSSDGSRIFFLTPGSEPCGEQQLYRRDLDTGTTTLISGPPDSGDLRSADFITANPSGDAVVFATTTSLAPSDTDELGDIYRWTEGGGHTCLTCVADGPADVYPVGAFSINAMASEDQSLVYFLSTSPPVQDGVPLGGVAGERNMYVWRVTGTSGPAGQISYVGPNSGSAQGRLTHDAVKGVQMTADGEVVVFSAADEDLNALTGSDNAGLEQVYRYDDSDRSLTCISCLDDQETTSSAYAAVETNITFYHSRTMSSDGSRVSFRTRQALATEDTNGAIDIYQWHEGRVQLITSGTAVPFNSSHNDRMIGISADGSEAAFMSYARLLPGLLQDGTNQMYVSRLGPPPPGFDFGNQPQVRCAGDGCKGPSSGEPAGQPAGTASFSGPSNPTARRCAKNRRQVTRSGKTRCLKRSKARKRGKERRTNRDRRASR